MASVKLGNGQIWSKSFGVVDILYIMGYTFNWRASAADCVRHGGLAAVMNIYGLSIVKYYFNRRLGNF